MDMAPVKPLDRKEKIGRLLQEMQDGLLERETQTRLILLAALAGEHVLLLGPPGTAKSELAKRLKYAFFEAGYFERLLTRFTVPEELFGPLSIQALEQDRYHRLTSGYLPEASVAFIDEIFKANSAILNSLLTLLNERQFDNGNTRKSVPLVSVIAASNELPEGEELNALYDRFMLRSFVEPVSDAAFAELLTLANSECSPELGIRLRIEDLNEVQALADKVELSSGVLALCQRFREYLAEQEIYVSDRRWRKIIKLIRVSAITNNQSEATIYDAWILPHCLWQKPEQLAGLVQIYSENICLDGDFNTEDMFKLVMIWADTLRKEEGATCQAKDDKGNLLYRDYSGKVVTSRIGKVQKTDKNGKPVYYDNYYNQETNEPVNRNRHKNDPVMVDGPLSPHMTTLEYSRAHVQDRVRQVGDLRKRIVLYIDRLRDQKNSAISTLHSHLWADNGMLPHILAQVESGLESADMVLEKVDEIINGFNNLPVESGNMETLMGV